MTNMSANWPKFDEEAHNGLASIMLMMFTSLLPWNYMFIVTLTFDI